MTRRIRRRKFLTPDLILISFSFNWFCLLCLLFACFLLSMGGVERWIRSTFYSLMIYRLCRSLYMINLFSITVRTISNIVLRVFKLTYLTCRTFSSPRQDTWWIRTRKITISKPLLLLLFFYFIRFSWSVCLE